MAEFDFKSFEQMTDEDYKKIGFKSGLEIHQQLLTDRKLYCRCPAGIYSNEYNAEILRHMRPTLSELGEYDGTALMEFKTKKDIIYQINYDTVCTYEMDDTPPFELNNEALNIALEIAMNYKCSIVDEIHIARKQYLDGSIPTGFQRTTLVGVDGTIPFKDRKIHIIQVGLEEDACRERSDYGHQRVYITDRLGMPLVETVTAPEMKTPSEVAEVAELLSSIVKNTFKVRTGTGAAREDVNVSVRGGTRIEIKGVSSIKKIPLLVYNEAMRQWNLLKLKKELNKRGITNETFETSVLDVSRLIKKTKYQPIRNAIQNGHSVKCVLLKGFQGLLRWRTQTDTFFSKEISDRVRVIACLSDLPNIIHSDSSGETIVDSEWSIYKKHVGATAKDAVVIVWGNESDTLTAVNEIIIRCQEATIGIPSETRQALTDGTNGFERILPGPERMYPDTDLPPIRITQERINTIKSSISNYFWERELKYNNLKIPKDLIRPLAISSYNKLFDFLVDTYKINPTLAAVALIQYPKRLAKNEFDVSKFDEKIFLQVFELYRDKKISREGIYILLKSYLENEEINICNIPKIDESNYNIIEENINELKEFRLRKKEKSQIAYTGLIMNKVRGKISGRKVAEEIKKYLQKEKKNARK